MSNISQAELSAKILAATHKIYNLLSKIDLLEMDDKLSADEKLSQISNLKKEILKVGQELDGIKKEISLLKAYNVN